ncbi:hypothetical protein [Sinorhizobium sp. RAC02]|uniref:hypothetical protein n=1 Tax=Sinorhizobium sp. RAC02 TaxID=1842534 RepID=UPI00123754D5|nr:hypothetical protein [Sinorhizobium sp. RAC02]
METDTLFRDEFCFFCAWCVPSAWHPLDRSHCAVYGGARRSGAGSKLLAERPVVIARLIGIRLQDPFGKPVSAARRQAFRVRPGRHDRDRQRYPLQA